ncbi:MAG TPA: MFS transporter, partial [Candidatus Bathyarchaeia archaeon]|nr:MFS transporter [Candidatus Bathyarchaeia archaeon]
MNAQVGLVASQDRRKWVAIVAVGLSLFLSALDATIVALALPPIASRFQLSDSVAAAITLSYAIPLTLLVLPSGALVSRFRALPTFLVSILGFVLGSVACGLAPNFLVLLTGRIVQGSFAALIATQGVALAAAVVLPKERGRAMGIVGTIAPLGGVAGPGIGGLLLANFGWSSIFFVNVPVGLLASLLGFLSLRGVSLGHQGPANNVYHQMAGLLRRPQFLLALIAFFSSVSASVALYYLLPFDLSEIQHIDPALSGLVLLCVPLGMMTMGITGGYLSDRYHAKPFMLAGSGLLLIGSLALSLVVSSTTSWTDLAWRLLLVGMGLVGMGIGLFSSPTMTLIMAVGRDMMAAASTASNLVARLGTVFGPIVMGITWTIVRSLSAQMVAGILLVDILASATLIFAYLPASWLDRNPDRPQAQTGTPM